jgi:hypothetical protein
MAAYMHSHRVCIPGELECIEVASGRSLGWKRPRSPTVQEVGNTLLQPLSTSTSAYGIAEHPCSTFPDMVNPASDGDKPTVVRGTSVD